MPSARSSRLLRTVCYTLLLSLTALAAPAQAPTYEVHPDYLVKYFTVEDGLPVNAITGFVQARDGYLWMTTFDGFVRFDGERFTVFNTENSPGLTSNRFHNLVEDGDGALWTVTEAGDLLRYFDGVFTTFDQDDGVPGRINTLQIEGDTLWLKTQEGLAFFHEGRVRPFYPQDVQGDVSEVLRSRSGDLWVGTASQGLYRVRADGDVQHFTAQDGLPNLIVEALHEDRNGVLWAGLRRRTRAAPQEGGVYGFQGGRFEPVTQAGRPWSQQITMIFSDPNDAETLWFGTYESELRGWWSYRDGVLKPFPAVEMGDARHHLLRGPDGALWRIQGHWVYRNETPVLLTQGNQRLLSFDREGNLWVAGLGLHRLQRRALRTISDAEGVGRNLYPILEDRAGRIWLGSWSEPRLARLDGGAVTTYEVDSCCVTSLHEDRAGMLWVGTIAGACRMQGGRCVSFDLRPVSANSGNSGVRAMLEDRQERFWIGTEHGLFLGRLTEAGRSWTHFTIETGLTSNWVRAIVETRDGDVLLGTNGGGMLRYRPDDTFEAFTTAEGLASDYVRDIYEDDSGILWIATEDRGLCRLDRRGSPPLQGAGLVCLNADDGLFDNSLHRILEDDYGRFWFNTNRGSGLNTPNSMPLHGAR